MGAKEFGHNFLIGTNLCIDSWGAGPFLIHVDGKTYRFEDSDRFGPSFVTRRGDISANQPGERHPFWRGHYPWVRQGRRLEADGVTCIWEPLKPTYFKKVGRKLIITVHGDADGPYIEETTGKELDLSK